MKIGEDERPFLIAEARAYAEHLSDPDTRTAFEQIALTAEQGEVPDELIPHVAGLLALALESGRTRTVHGPAGVRGERWDERDPSANVRSPTALAASWDEDRVERLGRLLAGEARPTPGWPGSPSSPPAFRSLMCRMDSPAAPISLSTRNSATPPAEISASRQLRRA